jgi:hypothetical protein
MKLAEMVLDLPLVIPIKAREVAAGKSIFYRDLIDGETRFVFMRREDDATADFSWLHRPALWVAITLFGFVQYDIDGEERARSFLKYGHRTFIDRNFPVTIFEQVPRRLLLAGVEYGRVADADGVPEC